MSAKYENKNKKRKMAILPTAKSSAVPPAFTSATHQQNYPRRLVRHSIQAQSQKASPSYVQTEEGPMRSNQSMLPHYLGEEGGGGDVVPSELCQTIES